LTEGDDIFDYSSQMGWLKIELVCKSQIFDNCSQILTGAEKSKIFFWVNITILSKVKRFPFFRKKGLDVGNSLIFLSGLPYQIVICTIVNLYFVKVLENLKLILAI
jgi:hypothetical protein